MRKVLNDKMKTIKMSRGANIIIISVIGGLHGLLGGLSLIKPPTISANGPIHTALKLGSVYVQKINVNVIKYN